MALIKESRVLRLEVSVKLPAFFIKKDSDDTIYKNDLGALGSIEMESVATDVYEFIKQSGEGIDFSCIK